MDLPMPTKQGWRWERVYRGQTLIVETYREMGQTIAELRIKGDCNHYFMHSDYETSPCEYCEQGMDYLEFLVEEKLGVYEDEKVTA
jgi:hypothetical protein